MRSYPEISIPNGISPPARRQEKIVEEEVLEPRKPESIHSRIFNNFYPLISAILTIIAIMVGKYFAPMGIAIFISVIVGYYFYFNSKRASNSRPKVVKKTSVITIVGQYSNKLSVNRSNIVGTAQKGRSEEHFMKFLRKHSLPAVFGNQYPIPNSQFSYTSDFELYFPGINLGIQIEIDEPYDGKSKRPHHCLDTGKDDVRDRFFNDRGWVVIRLAEEQVVRHPDLCCRLINEIIANIVEGQLIRTSVPRIRRWNLAEAKQMAKNDYRQDYLCKFGLWKRRN
jgi:hypothetical protein